MAKTSKIAKERQRRATVQRYAEKRARLKQAVLDAKSPEEQLTAVRALSKLPRDASPVRLRNRDQVDGRPRGYLRQFGLSRINVRSIAHRGELPGVTKSSW